MPQVTGLWSELATDLLAVSSADETARILAELMNSKPDVGYEDIRFIAGQLLNGKALRGEKQAELLLVHAMLTRCLAPVCPDDPGSRARMLEDIIKDCGGDVQGATLGLLAIMSGKQRFNLLRYLAGFDKELGVEGEVDGEVVHALLTAEEGTPVKVVRGATKAAAEAAAAPTPASSGEGEGGDAAAGDGEGDGEAAADEYDGGMPEEEEDVEFKMVQPCCGAMSLDELLALTRRTTTLMDAVR